MSTTERECARAQDSHELDALHRAHAAGAEVGEELILRYRGLAGTLARRFVNRGEPVEDLEQVAVLGLIGAVRRFDPDRGVPFVAFAVPVILGEIKRHFRDQVTAVRVPRRLRELRIRAELERTEVAQRLGRTPTIPELAAHLSVDVDQLVEALDVPLSVASLDAAIGEGASMSAEDPVLETLEAALTVPAALDRLAPSDRRLIEMRFGEELSQAAIAERLGVSQMQVSRLLDRVLRRLRPILTAA